MKTTNIIKMKERVDQIIIAKTLDAINVTTHRRLGKGMYVGRKE